MSETERATGDGPANREIRAVYDEFTVRVYQAYRDEIAEPAVERGAFVCPPFKLSRMTWIKPSFLWMMYRSGWATKEGQENVLAVDITREGFEWALSRGCLSHYESDLPYSEDEWNEQMETGPVRIQWDPERDIHLDRLPYRSIQIGLQDEAIRRYVDEWIVDITDVTERVHEIHDHVRRGSIEDARRMLPDERVYPVPSDIRERLCMTDRSA